MLQDFDQQVKIIFKDTRDFAYFLRTTLNDRFNIEWGKLISVGFGNFNQVCKNPSWQIIDDWRF